MWMFGRISKKMRKNAGNLAKYWIVLCVRGVRNPGLCGGWGRGWGQSGLHWVHPGPKLGSRWATGPTKVKKGTDMAQDGSSWDKDWLIGCLSERACFS